MHAISDANDPRLTGFRNLPARSDLRSDVIIVESELAVRRLLRTALRVHGVLAVDKRAASLDVPAGVPFYVATAEVVDAIVGFPMRRGAIALAERPRAGLDALARSLDQPGIIVGVSGVSDPANLGAIARNCCALGANGILVDPRGGDIYARKSIRTSMGNVLAQTVVVAELPAAIAALKRAAPDLVVAAATLSPRAVDLRAYRAPPRLLLVLGNEGAGVPAEVLAACDVELTIPMQRDADSLNVAAASAVFLYALHSGLTEPHRKTNETSLPGRR